MWYDELKGGSPWSSLWHGQYLCGCGGIAPMDGPCSGCGAVRPPPEIMKIRDNLGKEYEVPSAVVPGAEGRYEDYVYLKMMEREWKRPLTESDRFLDISESSRPSPRAIIAVVFWSYFETRIERLLRAATTTMPPKVTEDLLQRYSGVGARMDRLYKVLFGSTYWLDLEAVGIPCVASLLRRVQEGRNAFAHGHPEAIDDTLVAELVNGLKDEHEAWVAIFNRRAAHAPGSR